MKMARGAQGLQGAYSQWLDQFVILQIRSGEVRIPLRGIILGETERSIRFRVDDSWDIEIYKHMILAVEEESWMDDIT